MTSVRIFFIGGLISFRALFNWLSPWVYIPSMLVAPIVQPGGEVDHRGDAFAHLAQDDLVHLHGAHHDWPGHALAAHARLLLDSHLLWSVD